MITISLPPDVEKRLQGEASRQGVAAEEYARQIIMEHLPQSSPGAPLETLFAQWEREDRTTDPAVLARREQEWDELKRALNRNREEMEGHDSRQPCP